jgi:acyl transferase domain-containing protein
MNCDEHPDTSTVDSTVVHPHYVALPVLRTASAPPLHIPSASRQVWRAFSAAANDGGHRSDSDFHAGVPVTPIAIIGLACRLPQAPDPAAFWRLLRLGESAITTMPADRGASRAWPGGFLDDVASFDAEFFGISPREAVAMDPQQRLMLELAWEAMEDAGIRPPSLAGTDTGVFVGAIWDDYAALLRRSELGRSDLGGSAQHAMTGVHRSIIANRVSYRYDFHGPSLHVDTAQSASLVAVHLACESLRRGECALALAGGVNLILAEDSMEMAAHFGGLSPDGRCHTFDARANGFVRGEGGGAVLLKPLTAAVWDGDPVYCVILGGAVNSDGSTDSLTVPSAAAQEDVLRKAYRGAGVSPVDVQYVELHGSGTPVGDPVEAAALGAVAGSARPAGSPLPVGSVKTNIGHLEGAGGIAGLIKTALGLKHGQLPPSLNFSTPNPRIPLDRLGLRVQDRLTGWPHPDRPLLAGVSSFGMGGTNCHLVLAQAPAPAPEPADAPFEGGTTEDVPWPLSGTSPAALAAQAGRLRRHMVGHPEADPADVGYSLGTTRSAFTHRAVIFGADAEERLGRLAAIEQGTDAAGSVQGRVTDGGLALLFGGQGSRRATMGRDLYAAHPRFAGALDEAWALLDPRLGGSLRELTFGGDDRLDQTPFTQAAVFALDVALFRLAESWGLAADFVLGHAVGEVAAAHVAGVLPLADACALAVAYGRLLQGPQSEAARDEFRAVVSGLSFAAPAIPMVFTVTGRSATAEQFASPDYWIEQAREPGRMTARIEDLRDRGVATFLELGPQAQHAPTGSVVVAALGGDRPETAAFAAAMAEVYVRGAELDWEQVFAGRRCRRLALPTYAFQRGRYWPGNLPEPVAASPAGAREDMVETVRATVAAVLGHATSAAVDPGLTFKQLGFNSIAGTELSQRLSTETGLPLTNTLIFDYPTPNEVAAHLRNLVLRPQTTMPGRRGTGLGSGDDPIVIVGMACRYPGGAGSPGELWDLVAAGKDVVGDFPANRGWDLSELFDPDPQRSGRSYTRAGGFLHDADLFDAGFFGISPREAVAMDPQQRLLLETAWQAFESAGIGPATLRGSETSVIIGATGQEYGPRMHEAAGDLDGQLLTGTTPSVIAGRLAFSFGLEGPAMTVDTACSSSLVAIHLAGQSLRQGECSLALAGGVTVMATPGMFVEFSRQRGLSPDGRCKAFAAAADGTGWAEGVGVVVLERLSDAARQGHRVWAVIRGSAVNQDGASNGLSAPNGPSQERVIRQALANAHLTAADVDVVEAHGTGTTLGDPIEAQALIAAYGQDRSGGRPLWLGSLKSNLGHTQAAAGVAGVIKMVMALRHGVLPPTLHVDAPTPHVDWSAGEVRLLTEPVEWPRSARPRRAAVSSFGVSGTNAHLILEEAPDQGGSAPSAATWVLSAHTDEGLRAMAQRLGGFVAQRPELSPVDVGCSLVRTRSVFAHRAVVLGRDRGALLHGVTALADGTPDAGVVTGAAVAAGPGPLFVFPGQGSQWVGMGAELLDSSPVFAARIAECERALAPYADWVLTDVLRGAGGELDRVDVVQPVLWAVMVSLAAVWADYGVMPAAVIGHSQGEIAAACVAGILSLDEAARVVALRSRALRRLSGRGAMAWIGASDVDRLAPDVTVAAVNGPSSTVISGPPEQVRAVVADAKERGLHAQLIDVDYASHGPAVDEVTDELAEALSGITPAGGHVPFYSTVTGTRTAELDTAYWIANLRQPVWFADVVNAMLGAGYRVFIEVSPHPVLTSGVEECIDQAGTPAAALGTLRRDQGGTDQILLALAGAFTAGVDVDWTRCYPTDPPPRIVDLPTYPFQRERYWLPMERGLADAADLGLSPTGHPTLAAAMEPADADGRVLSGRVARHRQPWLADHVIAGTLLVPGAAQLEWALRAADEVGCAGVEELVIHTPLAVPEPGGLRVQVVVGAAGDDGRREVGVYSSAGAAWTRHATGVLGAGSAGPAEPQPGGWPPAGAEPVDLAGFYARTEAAGYGYGPVFQGLRAMWRHGSDVFAEIELPEVVRDRGGFGVHPALLDAALHPLLDGRLDGDGTGVWLPFTWSDVVLHAVGATSLRVRLSLLGAELDQGVRLTATDPAGGPVLDAEVALRWADNARLRAAGEQTQADPSPGVNGRAIRRRAAAPAGGGQQGELARRLAGLATGERRRMVLDLVRGHSAAVLGYPDPAQVRLDATFTEMGLGSVMAVELRDRLASATGLSLPAALVFGHPTPRHMAGELLRRVVADGGATRSPQGVAGPLLAEVSRLEYALAGVEAGESDLDAVTERLERLLETWKQTHRATGDDQADGADAADRLRSASTEQVLDFIDNELGVGEW